MSGRVWEPVGAVAGHFSGLPPTPAPHGAGTAVPDRMLHHGFVPVYRGAPWPDATGDDDDSDE